MTQCDDIAYFLLQRNADALLYTGLDLETFDMFVSTLEGHASNSFTMPVRDQVLMTLMKLKTNRVIGDLSRQFHESLSMARKIISYWIDKLEEVLRPLIPWLPRETIWATMHAAFKRNVPSTPCIINCSESLLQKPQNLDSRRETYSHYYSHNTEIPGRCCPIRTDYVHFCIFISHTFSYTNVSLWIQAYWTT